MLCPTHEIPDTLTLSTGESTIFDVTTLQLLNLPNSRTLEFTNSPVSSLLHFHLLIAPLQTARIATDDGP